MTEEKFKEILDKKETDTVEFKSWVNARNMKEIILLAVDELIAFANSKGGTVYFGVEDNPVVVTRCDRNYDGQRIIEGIYDRTVPLLFTEISDFEYEGKLVIAISFKADGKTYTTTDTEFVKFITEVQDKNSKIMSLAEMMILRDLLDNRKEQLSELARVVQKSLDETKKSCNEMINLKGKGPASRYVIFDGLSGVFLKTQLKLVIKHRHMNRYNDDCLLSICFHESYHFDADDFERDDFLNLLKTISIAKSSSLDTTVT